jgi:hypothetical protein
MKLLNIKRKKFSAFLYGTPCQGPDMSLKIWWSNHTAVESIARELSYYVYCFKLCSMFSWATVFNVYTLIPQTELIAIGHAREEYLINRFVAAFYFLLLDNCSSKRLSADGYTRNFGKVLNSRTWWELRVSSRERLNTARLSLIPSALRENFMYWMYTYKFWNNYWGS